MKQTVYFGICLFDLLGFKYVFFWRGNTRPDITIFAVDWMNIQLQGLWDVACLLYQVPHHIPLICWLLSATTFAVPDWFISFQKHSTSEMLGGRRLVAPHAHCGEGENTFQRIRDLNCPLEMLLSSHWRQREPRTVAWPAEGSTWHQARHIWCVDSARGNYLAGLFPARPSPEEGNGVEQSPVLVPAYQALLSAAVSLLQLFSAPPVSQLPLQLLRLNNQSAFLPLQKSL